MLTVKLQDEDRNENPEFACLLKDLTKHISQNGCSTTLDNKLSQQRQLLKDERLRFIQYQALHNELKEVLLQHRSESMTRSQPNQFYSHLGESLALSEAMDYLRCSHDNTSNVTLLGLNDQNINDYGPQITNHLDVQQQTIPAIEKNLMEQCENIYNSYTGTVEQSGSSQLSDAKLSQLPMVIRTNKELLEKNRKRLSEIKEAKKEHLTQYHQLLLKIINVMEEVFSRHCFQSQKENNYTKIELLGSRTEALKLKIKIVEQQLLCDTYSSDSIKALNTIKEELKSTIKKNSEELRDVQKACDSYTQIGPIFDDLVREYNYLQDEISKKEWMLTKCEEKDTTGIEFDETFS